MKKYLFPLPSRLAWGLLATSLTFALVAHAVGLKNVGNGASRFTAGGPAGLKINGTGKGVTAEEKDGVVTVTAPLKGLDTGISLRDEHLEKALASAPTAKFSVPRSALKFPADKQTLEDQKGLGKFTMNGVTKDGVKFKYTVTRQGSHYIVDGKAPINIEDYKIEPPCYLGVCVDKDVIVGVNFKVGE